jgi:hypothetical protein
LGLLTFALACSPINDAAQQDESVTWPIRVEYDLLGNNGVDPNHRIKVVWTARSLLEWETVQVCCDAREVGWTMQVHVDGRVFSGGSQGTPIEFLMTHEPHDGMVPIPEFGPSFPTTLSELLEHDFIRVTADYDLVGVDPAQLEVLAVMAEALGLRPDDLISYEIESPQSRTLRVVYKPLNLTLFSEELVDGAVLRRLQVTRLESLDT